MKPRESSVQQSEEPSSTDRALDDIRELEAEAAADPAADLIDPAPLMATVSPSASGSGIWWILLTLVTAWSLNFIFIKIGIQVLTPLSSNAPLAVANARVIIAAVALALILLVSRRRLRRLTWNDFGFLLFLGATGVSLNQFFFVNGLARTSVAHGALLLALTPITVFLLALASRQERLSVLKASGMGLAILGTSLLIRSGHGHHATWLGDVLMILKVLAFAIYTVTSKHVRGRFETLTFTFYVHFFGTALLAPLSWHTLRHTHWTAIPERGWIAILYIALIGSVLAYTVFYRALKIMSASQLAALTYLEPVVTMIAGVLILHEHVTPQILAGGAVILCGVYLTQLKKSPVLFRRAAA